MHTTAVILGRSFTLDDESLVRVQNTLHEQFPPTAPVCAQLQIKFALYLLYQKQSMRILKDWGSLLWMSSSSDNISERWAISFSIFVMLVLTMEKVLEAAYNFCLTEAERKCAGETERAMFQKLAKSMEKELFDRCKEIFHWRFRTRKGGREACNPIRDGIEAFQGKLKSASISASVKELISDVQQIAWVFGKIHSPTPYPESLRLTFPRSRNSCTSRLNAEFRIGIYQHRAVGLCVPK